MNKYLIGLIPSIFILMIACFAKSTPIQQTPVVDNNSQYITVTMPGTALFIHKQP